MSDRAALPCSVSMRGAIRMWNRGGYGVVFVLVMPVVGPMKAFGSSRNG